MKAVCATAGLALLACALPFRAHADAPCSATVEAPLRARAVLNIDSRPAGLEIVGTDQSTIHVTCTAKDSDVAGQVRLHLSGDQDKSQLHIESDSHEGNLQVRIEVPRKTNLIVKMSAGQVKVEDVTGDKDIDLYAGQISISSERSWDYHDIHLAVDIGDVNAQVYGTDKGGFFRTFSKHSAQGEYTLRAHVLTGQIELLGKQAATTTD